jgi:membrane dipeptidase
MELFDLHCDTPFRCFTEKKDFLKNDLDISFEKAGCFSKWNQIFAVWVREETPSPFDFYKSVLTDFKSKLIGCEREGFNPLFSIEGGSVIEEIDYLNEIKNDGVSVITLTWNGKNKIASGANEKGGLTAFGEAVIKKMNSLKIATDLSHLNEESFFDAITVTDYPIATHSCSKSVFNHK